MRPRFSGSQQLLLGCSPSRFVDMAKALCQGFLRILRAGFVQSPEPQQGRAAAEAKWPQLCGLKVCLGREPANHPRALPVRERGSQRNEARRQKRSRERLLI